MRSSNHGRHLLYFQGSETKAASASAPPAAAPAAPKVIPRLVDSSGTTPLSRSGGNLDPATWDVDDVSSFLGINECATLVESFKEQVSVRSVEY